jgi:hypothetical protein
MKFINRVKFLADLPPLTAIGVVVIAASTVWFAIFFPLLGGYEERTRDENAQLTREISEAEKGATQSSEDEQFIRKNKELYDEIVHGDRLIPHTRRAAIHQLQDLALQRGLSSLSYTFTPIAETSAKGVTSQPKGDLYHVSVENIELKVAAPLDTQLFDFVLDMGEAFPGAAVVQSVDFMRPGTIDEQTLERVGSRDSGIVTGSVKLLWRTAQANEEKKSK